MSERWISFPTKTRERPAPGPPRAPLVVPHPAAFLARLSTSARAHLVAMWLLVVGTTGLVGWAFLQAPLAPGVDPGHWLAISYTYVGLPTAPDPTDRVLSYSPLMFPWLGGLVRLTGSPLVAVDLAAVSLFGGYAASLLLLARRFVASGPLQLALVGLVLSAGTTIQMVFWGGYPNLLGFLLMDVALVTLLRFVRSRRNVDAATFFTTFALTYLAHDLSFAILLAAVALAVVYLLATRLVPLTFLRQPSVLVGMVGVGATIGAYSAATAALGIPHPSYLSSNPSAYTIDEVGELFAPLAHAPVYVPPANPAYLPPLPTAVLLASAPLFALVALLLLRQRRPDRLDTRLVLGAGWLAAAVALPGVGYLAHVETDYTRFLYFLPLPFTLVLLLAIERAFLPRLLPRAGASSAPGPDRLRRAAPHHRRQGPGAPTVAMVVVAILVPAIYATVTIPVVLRNEAAGTASAHDANFLAAEQWLRDRSGPGNVLTTSSAARWTEALALRDALTIGPVWLLFDPFQIVDAQETYWALTSEYALSNGQCAVAFSGFATPVDSQAPLYAAYDEGVPFPVFRVLPGSILLNASGPNGSGQFPAQGGGVPQLTVTSTNGTAATVVYTGAAGRLVETTATSPDGSASISWQILPDAGEVVHALTLELGPAPPQSTSLDTDTTTSVTLAGTELAWSVQGKLGQYPTPVTIPTAVDFSEPPATWSLAGPPTGYVSLTFADAAGTTPFPVTMTVRSGAPAGPTAELPAVLATQAFLNEHAIHYLLWPNTTDGTVETTYYASTFGFHPVYSNPEWVILEA